MQTLTKQDIIDITLQICEVWGIEQLEIKFLEHEYMDTVLGIAAPNHKVYNGNLWSPINLIVLNDILLHYPMNKIMQVLYHELAHIVTRKNDNDHEFEMFCKLNGIPLSGDWEEEMIV